MPSLDKFTAEKLDKTKENDQYRSLNITERSDGVCVKRNGKELISFSCNDYFGLSQDKKVMQAAMDATEKYGAGAAASRLITGNNPLYQELEKKLAALKNTENALVLGSGYLANIGIIPALMGKKDLIIADKFAHSCILDGARLSGAKLLRFAHNDLENCHYLLKKHRKSYKNCLIITETIFSMDGDRAPLDGLHKLAKKHDSWLMTDDAHGIGIIKGNKADIQVGTLSKAAGSYGGYVCGSNALIDYITNSAKSLIYSTALPPSVLAASNEAISIIANNPDICQNSLENAQYFAEKMGLKKPDGTIVPLVIGESDAALAASKNLYDNGYLVSAIRPPTIPKGTARLRFTFSSLHKRQDIDNMCALMSTR